MLCALVWISGCIDSAGLGDLPGPQGGGGSGGEVVDDDAEAGSTGTGLPETSGSGGTGTQSVVGGCSRTTPDAEAEHDWALVCGSQANEQLGDIVVTPEGDTLLTLLTRPQLGIPAVFEFSGATIDTDPDGGGFVLRLDPEGELVSARFFPRVLETLLVAPCGEGLALAGHSAGTDLAEAQIGDGAFVALLDAAGEVDWVEEFPSIPFLTSLECDDASNIIVGGGVSSDIDFGDGEREISGEHGFVAKYATDGALVFARVASPPGVDIDTGFVHAAVPHADGSIGVVARQIGPVDFGAGIIPPMPGPTNAVLARLTAEGDPMWTTQLGGDGFVEADTLRVDELGGTVVGGWFDQTIDLGDGSFSSRGDLTDGFAASFDANGVMRWGFADESRRGYATDVLDFVDGRTETLLRDEQGVLLVGVSERGFGTRIPESFDTSNWGRWAGASAGLEGVVVATEVESGPDWPPGARDLVYGSSDIVLVHYPR